MRDWKSVSHCTANEDGVEEITITRNMGLFEWSHHMLQAGSIHCDREITEVYVVDGLQWVDKKTRIAPDADKQYELFEIKGSFKKYGCSLTA
jgi:hypothetical protein